MKSILFSSIFLAVFWKTVLSLPIQEEITTPFPPARPYAFGYAAGRYPGHIDRTHSEVSDGSGVVQGSFSYVDPRYKIRTVEYIADNHGFHPVLNENVPDLPSDTPVVAAAKANHLRKYAAIATSHQTGPNQVIVPADTKAVEFARNKHLSLFQQIAEEHARLAAETEALRRAEGIVDDPNSVEHY